MKYSSQEVVQYVQEEDVKFIRLAFCDIYGRQKNISIMPDELPRAFEYGIALDASAIDGFGDETHSDLMLHPDASTLAVLPWRPEHGRVVRMFCDITYPDGRGFECDTRAFLKKAIQDAKSAGVAFAFGAEMEFYLFMLDENGGKTQIPYDTAGYMDIAPDDKGENVRREICLTLEQMGIRPESSHHEEGPGQNEIDFRYSDPLSAADNAMTFQTLHRSAPRVEKGCGKSEIYLRVPRSGDFVYPHMPVFVPSRQSGKDLRCLRRQHHARRIRSIPRVRADRVCAFQYRVSRIVL